MRLDAPTLVTAAGLLAGLGIVVASLATGAPAPGTTVEELYTVDVAESFDGLVPIGDAKFHAYQWSGGTYIVDAEVGTSAGTANYPNVQEIAHWDDEERALYYVDYSGVRRAKSPGGEAPRFEAIVSSATYAKAVDTEGGVVFLGNPSSQIFRAEGERVIEQRLKRGECIALAALDGYLIAATQTNQGDEGELHLFRADDLTLLHTVEDLKVSDLLAVGGSTALAAGDNGLFVCRIEGDKLVTKKEVAGSTSLSDNAHDGCTVVTTTRGTALLDIVNGTLRTIKTLSHRRAKEADFCEGYLAVVYDERRREVVIYRLSRPNRSPSQ